MAGRPAGASRECAHGTADATGRVVVNGHRARDTGDPGWIDFPPRWPEMPEPGGRHAEAEEERPAVMLTTPIPGSAGASGPGCCGP